PNMVFYWQNQPDSNDDTLQPLADFRFKAYPNPFKISEKKQINIEINSKKDSNYKLSIFNVKGQKITHFEEKRIGSGISQVSYTLNTNELASGIYFLKMESSNESQLKKILILK
ncbi:MAG TPA: T9SS type A sorting domain-containing protein, partial [Candidatus Cloacimonadota bacterium]|nr:T9SS type A sorting domain-containing protein [Candidatus Cloacimonadota bacterium]